MEEGFRPEGIKPLALQGVLSVSQGKAVSSPRWHRACPAHRQGDGLHGSPSPLSLREESHPLLQHYPTWAEVSLAFFMGRGCVCLRLRPSDAKCRPQGTSLVAEQQECEGGALAWRYWPPLSPTPWVPASNTASQTDLTLSFCSLDPESTQPPRPNSGPLLQEVYRDCPI